jgi:hypothetical protein
MPENTLSPAQIEAQNRWPVNGSTAHQYVPHLRQSQRDFLEGTEWQEQKYQTLLIDCLHYIEGVQRRFGETPVGQQLIRQLHSKVG